MANQKPPKEDFSLKETSPNISGRRVSTGPMTAFDLVEHMQYLYVRVVKARGLPAIADPYVELKLGNYRAITRPMVKNPNPEWNQVFAFSKDRIQVVSVEILVKDKAVVAEGGDHRTIGKFAFALVEAPTRVPPDSPLAPQWYMLEDKNKARTGGELMLSFWIGTQADEAFPEAWHADVAAVSGDGVSSTRSKVYLSPRLWYMRVNVIQAQDLVLKDKNKKTPEFFVKAQFGNLILRSGVSPNKTVNPTWNEDLMFVVAEPFDDPLVVSVEEKLNNNKEESMGRIVVPLGDIAKRNDAAAAAPKWYNLGMVEVVAGVQKEVKFASKVQMRVSLDGGYHVLDEPAHSTSDLRPTAKILWKPPIGVLEMGILNATGLSPMKPKNQVDAYCVAKYGMKWVRTRTVVDSLSPKWNEQYTWEVYDPCTVIAIGVFDNGNLQDKAAMDLSIGKVKIRLSTLETDRIYTHSYPLVALQPSGVKKMGEIQLALRFSCPNMLNLLQLYSQPLLPKMHYVLPLSIYQLASLRHQAALILWLRLSRAEPPLRKEVVDCMLDATAHLWSFRRGKANFDRIIKLFDGLVALFKWFDQIRKWTNPLASALVYITFVFVLCQPGLTIAAAFLCLSFRGALNYRKRPRQIAHIDTELSHAYDVHPEDLDEEFDSFPSKKTGDVLKRRYDRLRGIAGRIQAVLGDIATQGERVQSLLSWRDPRATALFVIFCLIVGIVFCVVPAWWLALFAGTYVMRPPYWRINIPTFPQNFLRRMPAKSDSIL
ncbi:PREDICTED: protein QUIRKY-like [Prunus mume]|uniref:Protein QUIRKY-like n=1 Tax=Prunus mume TaxID=102107 RepID=A0ABM0NKI7_PRUMU|nr:PREDICTED: protein QUIRKY-like [Prunus mume]